MGDSKNANTNAESLVPTSTDKSKKPFQEPKLEFIEPKLVKHGDATELTKQGFFGTFTPDDL